MRERVKYFNDVKKRERIDEQYHSISLEIGNTVYGISGFKYDKDYYTIPEISKDINEMTALSHEYRRLCRLEEEAKCKGPKPEARMEIVDSFHIDGDIVVTDPCYIKRFVEPEHSRDTLYGDWGCSVWSFDPEKGDTPEKGAKPFGKFCADGGMVCVTALDEEARRKVEEWLTGREWCAAIIEKFSGVVEYVERVNYFACEGAWEEDRNLIIRGKGTKDGKPFGFITAQTSL